MKLIQWNHTHDCCQWKGVACSTKGNVIVLDISHEFIKGGNLTSLFNLQYLQRLNLAYNEFNSDFHYEFQNLQMNLRHLNLSNAGFMGQIPIEISYLIKLETLDLSTTFTSSQHALKLEKPNIVEVLQNLTTIKELYLDGLAISTKGEEWCHAVSSLQSLQVLSMSSCNLSGPLDPSLTKLQSLSVLQLSHNNLASPVPEHLGNLSSLKTLQLRNCGFSGVFPKAIFQLPSLEVLDMSDNQGLHGSLPPSIPHQLASLKFFNLSYTKFSGPLSESLLNMRQLSTLDLSNLALFHLSSGPMLLGGDNSFDGTVPSTLFALPSLQQLILSYNRFEGPLKELPNCSSSSLEMLDLSGNNLQGPIPSSIFQLKRLSLLQLSTNQFSGTIYLNKIRSLPHLKTFDLSHNNLSVVVDDADQDVSSSAFPMMNNLLLASCRNHTQLDLEIYNQINNVLVGMEGPFQNLGSNLFLLDLHGNQLQGPAPIFTKSIFYLDYSTTISAHSFQQTLLLDLSDNRFDGEIPKCLTTKSLSLRTLSNNPEDKWPNRDLSSTSSCINAFQLHRSDDGNRPLKLLDATSRI
ncbi:hypothetical protein PIB30_064093 [Stylosanthes scabra]|uniref:Leucine-rich repeat-containing N-terminal plant-type domain-containing protein n=1 Tax=Stylosanthes scabra TaxID=79078 RepID=A0ABU6YKB3_9FABA|nr:hypothetical protein [Stylosanthes scabra]